MSTDPPDNSTPLPPLPDRTGPPLDVSKPPPSEWVAQLRMLRTIAATLLAANAAFFGVCTYASTKVTTFEAAVTTGVLASVISAAVVLIVLWPRNKVK